MGGMAAQIPVKNDPAANEEAFAKVRADKEREARDGHDGTWVAHPGMVQLALDAFNARHAAAKSDRPKARTTCRSRAQRSCSISARANRSRKQGLRNNVSVGVQYLEAWLRGHGAVPIFQSDGRCGDGGNFACASLAMDSPSTRRCSTDGTKSNERTFPQRAR